MHKYDEYKRKKCSRCDHWQYLDLNTSTNASIIVRSCARVFWRNSCSYMYESVSAVLVPYSRFVLCFRCDHRPSHLFVLTLNGLPSASLIFLAKPPPVFFLCRISMCLKRKMWRIGNAFSFPG